MVKGVDYIKRCISGFVVISLLLGCMILPASASEFNNEFSWIDVLDYDTINAQGNSIYFEDSYYRTYLEFPYGNYYFADVLLSLDSSVSEVIISNGLEEFILTPVRIGSSNLYRAFGSVGGAYFRGVELILNGSGHCTVESFKLSNSSVQGYTISGNILTSKFNGISSLGAITTSVLDLITPKVASYEHEITIVNWNQYDFIDVTFCVDAYSIDSINCTLGGIYLPVEYLSVSSSSNVENSKPPDGIAFYPPSQKLITLRIDLRGLNRSLNESPTITIIGSYYTGILSTYIFSGAFGYVESSVIDPDTSWLGKIYNNISKLIDTLRELYVPNQNIPDDFNDSVSTQATEFEEMIDIMDSVTRPDLEDVDPDISGMVNPGDVTLLTSGIKSILELESIRVFFLLSLTLCLVAYILYGKR